MSEPNMTSLGLTRAELRSEIDELIRNAYYAAWGEARRRPDATAPGLEIDWTQPGGVRITEIWDGTPSQGVEAVSIHDWRHVLNGLVEGSFPRVCTRCLMREDNPAASEPCDAVAERVAAREDAKP